MILRLNQRGGVPGSAVSPKRQPQSPNRCRRSLAHAHRPRNDLFTCRGAGTKRVLLVTVILADSKCWMLLSKGVALGGRKTWLLVHKDVCYGEIGHVKYDEWPPARELSNVHFSELSKAWSVRVMDGVPSRTSRSCRTPDTRDLEEVLEEPGFLGGRLALFPPLPHILLVPNLHVSPTRSDALSSTSPPTSSRALICSTSARDPRTDVREDDAALWRFLWGLARGRGARRSLCAVSGPLERARRASVRTFCRLSSTLSLFVSFEFLAQRTGDVSQRQLWHRPGCAREPSYLFMADFRARHGRSPNGPNAHHPHRTHPTSTRTAPPLRPPHREHTVIHRIVRAYV